MQRRIGLSLLALISLVLAAVPASISAQKPVSPTAVALKVPLQLPSTPERVPNPAVPLPSRGPSPQPATWTLLPAAPFQYTRFDAVFVPGPESEAWANRVYFLGGRDGSSTENPSIWRFDPASGAFADTGADMVEDVSNYTASLIMDDGTGRGPAVYVIGGTNADGSPAGPIGTVQRYYPQSNLAEALPSADNWTGLVAGNLVSAMGTAVVNDVVYVFGGFENLAEPYFYAGTWAFDPKLPSGSRWTDLGLALALARAYIQVAVQDGRIYAMGGNDQYVGGDLAPTTVVEMLDTANLAAGWQLKAPLPVASGEGRGFGFDTDTQAPVPWDGHLYLAGGGDWSSRSAEAMEYLVASDTWDQSFADLNQARRDHAGAFIPLCTPDPNDGLPGLWVFGGNIATDAPPFGDPEYYPLECAAAERVLLVDDDWDYASPNGGGRPYYTSALDALGIPFDVWDTVSQGQPTAADMAAYKAVIWFTGYAWQDGVFTPENEAELAAYLAGGGSFLLSSLDYHYEAGLTTFMIDYLGVGSALDDQSELDPVGNAGNPVGSGLGPYALTRPDDYDAYWPTGTAEGPYDDYVTAAAGAAAPFRYNASGENNSTNLDGGAWRTAFLAWPLEWVDTVAQRAEIMGQALTWLFAAGGQPEVRLTPPYQEGAAAPGTSIAYGLTLTNLLGEAATFDLAYQSVWPVTGPALVGPVSSGGSVDFLVEVHIPADAACGAQDLLVVTAEDPSNIFSDTAEIRTTAGGDWQSESNAGASPAHWMAFACTDAYGAGGTCFYAGGLGPGNAVTGVARRYDIASGVWSALPNLPTPVFGAVGGFVDGRFCVAGGFTTTAGTWGGTYVTQCYSPSTNAWAAANPIPGPPEIGGAGGATGGSVDGALHVVGGCGTNSCASNQHWAFDGSAWSALPVVLDFLVFSGAAAGDGRLFVGGDYSGATGFYEYNVAGGSWQTRASLPGGAGKKSPVGAVVPGGGVFWWGGDLGSWNGIQDTTWFWDTTANAWSQIAATLAAATTGAGGGMADGRLWSVGGSQGSGPIAPAPHESLAYCQPPPPPTGALQGSISDANTSQPVVDAYVWLEGVTDPSYYAEHYTDAAGAYSFDPLPTGDYLVSVSQVGYYSQLALPVAIGAGAVVTLDAALAASLPSLTPTSVSVRLPPNSTATFPMTLSNLGSADLRFHVTDFPGIARGAAKAEVPMPSGVDPQVRADLEAAPDGSARFVVYLATQADLSAAFGMQDRSERGAFVLDTLRRTAERSQVALRAGLDAAGVEYESRLIVNALVVRGDARLVDSLASWPEVAYIGPDLALAAPAPVESAPAPDGAEAIEWNIQRIRADDVWSVFDVTGYGIVVASIDTGVQYAHPALAAQYRGNQGGSYNHNHNWWDPYGQNPAQPTDAAGHGTHTMGTMVGSDLPADPTNAPNAIGVAPDAKWMACDGFDNTTGSGYTAELLECAEFMLAPWDLSGANPDPDLRPDIVNNSWGGGQAQWWYNQVVYAWRAAGIWPSFSIGNNGPGCGTAGDPGDLPNVISAGATDSTDTIAGFSSRGPAAVSGITKPNVAAPGSGIRSSVPGGYASAGGTSMASPHVAAEVALIWDAVPELRGDVQLTQWIVEQTTTQKMDSQCGPAGPPNNVYGWGIIDAYSAVESALAGLWDLPWLTIDPTGGTVPPNGNREIVLGFDSTGIAGGECVTGQLKFEYNDPYTVEEFVPVELCVCQGLTGVSITGPATLGVGQTGHYSATWEPVDATPPLSIIWSNGTSGSTAEYSWPAPGTYSVKLTASNCEGAAVVSDTLDVLVQGLRILLPIVVRNW